MRFLLSVVADAIALGLAVWLFDGISLTDKSTEDQVITLLLVAVILGLVNAIVSPLVKLLSLPFIVLTLGLFLLVINALMLLLTSWIAGEVGLAFHVDGFWTALLAALVVTIASSIIEAVLD